MKRCRTLALWLAVSAAVTGLPGTGTANSPSSSDLISKLPETATLSVRASADKIRRGAAESDFAVVGVIEPVARKVSLAGADPAKAASAGGSVYSGGMLFHHNGAPVWAMGVEAPGAEGVRLHFTGVSLPKGVVLTIRSADDSRLDGPYTGMGPWGDGDFWTPTFYGGPALVELTFPQGAGKDLFDEVSLTLAEAAPISFGGLEKLLPKQEKILACPDNLIPDNVFAPSSGYSDTFFVDAPFDCTWTPIPSDPWITVFTGETTSSGTVSYEVLPSFVSSRSGWIQVGEATFDIIQESGCFFTNISPSDPQNFASTGGTGAINVTISSPDCNWSVFSMDSWLTITSPGSNLGSGTITFTVAPNGGGLSRSTEIEIVSEGGGYLYQVIQEAGAGCTTSVNPTTVSHPSTGGSSFFSVTTSEPDCSWSAQSMVPWMTIQGSSTGVGNGSIDYTVNPNTGPERSGEIRVTSAGGTSVHSATQQGNCIYELNPFEESFDFLGGIGTVSVTTSPGCPWVASETSPWITILSGFSGTGSGTITYRVSQNTGDSRSDMIDVEGQGLLIFQDPASLIHPDPLTCKIPARDAICDDMEVPNAAPEALTLIVVRRDAYFIAASGWYWLEPNPITLQNPPYVMTAGSAIRAYSQARSAEFYWSDFTDCDSFLDYDSTVGAELIVREDTPDFAVLALVNALDYPLNAHPINQEGPGGNPREIDSEDDLYIISYMSGIETDYNPNPPISGIGYGFSAHEVNEPRFCDIATTSFVSTQRMIDRTPGYPALPLGSVDKESLGAPVLDRYGDVIGIMSQPCGTAAYIPCSNAWDITISRLDTIYEHPKVQQILTMAQSNSPVCFYDVLPVSRTGDTAVCSNEHIEFLTVDASPECSWTAAVEPAAEWIEIQRGTSGNGRGTVVYQVLQNATLQTRSANIVIRDGSSSVVATHTVEQREGLAAPVDLELGEIVEGTVDLCGAIEIPYRIQVPQNATELVVDLFERDLVNANLELHPEGDEQNVKVSRSYTTNDTIVLNESSNPPLVPGTAYIATVTISRFTDFTESNYGIRAVTTARPNPGTPIAIQLNRGYEDIGLNPATVPYRFYSVDIPTGTTEVTIRTTGSGDVDLYAFRGVLNDPALVFPDMFSYTVNNEETGLTRYSDLRGTSDELLVLNVDNTLLASIFGPTLGGVEGTWIIGVKAREETSTFDIVVRTNDRDADDRQNVLFLDEDNDDPHVFSASELFTSVTDYQYHVIRVPNFPEFSFDGNYGQFEGPKTSAVLLNVDVQTILGGNDVSIEFHPTLPGNPPAVIAQGFPWVEGTPTFDDQEFRTGELDKYLSFTSFHSFWPDFRVGEEYLERLDYYKFTNLAGDLLLAPGDGDRDNFRSLPADTEFDYIYDADNRKSLTIRRDGTARGNFVLSPGSYRVGVARRGSLGVTTYRITATLNYPEQLNEDDNLDGETETVTFDEDTVPKTDYYVVDVPNDAVRLTFDLEADSGAFNLYVNRGVPPFVRTGQYAASFPTLRALDLAREVIIVNGPNTFAPGFTGRVPRAGDGVLVNEPLRLSATDIPDSNLWYVAVRSNEPGEYTLSWDLDLAPFGSAGDITGDGAVTPADAQAIFEFYMKGQSGGPRRLALGDFCPVPGDGSLTPADAQSVFELYLRGIPGQCP